MRRTSLFLGLGSLLLATEAQASNQGPGYITNVEQAQSRFFFYMSGTRGTRPTCDCCGRWEIDASTAAGQSQIAILLTVYALHHTIQISGTGSCVVGANDTEGVWMLSSDR